MADTPPPVPRNRPKSQYVPPPIPTNRPKSSYVAPMFGSLTKSLKSQSSSKPTPTPKPRTSWSDEPSHQNHANPTAHSTAKGRKPSQTSAKPSLFPKPHSGTSNGQMSVTLDTAGASKAAFKAAMDPQTRSKAMTKEQEKDAGKLGWGITKNAAKQASMDDFKKASQAASKSSSSGKSASAAFGVSLISSQAKKDKPLMTQDQQKKAAKLSWGIGKNIAKNVSLNDVKKASSFVSVGSSSNQPQPHPVAAHRPAPTQPPTARERPKPTGPSNTSAGLPPPPVSSSRSVPLQTTSQPRPTAGSAFSLRPPVNDQSRSRQKPTIIRPGAGGQKAKPNSRSSSPIPDNNNTRKGPPPRPPGGPPAGRKGPPPRPSSVPTSKQKGTAGNNKPKRLAPKTPSLLEKHGLSSIEITPMAPSTGSDLDLPPRPGPGHQLYRHTVSQPHAIALYDFEGQDVGDLSFKGEDLIILTRKIDADWYIGSCGNREGMFPAQFVRIVRDITEERKGSVSSVSSGGTENISGPRCVAKFEYQSDEWDDLSFPEGAVIKLVERIDSDWLRGEYKGQTGLFPQGYVDVIEDIAVKSPQVSPALSLVSNDNIVTALFDFDAEDNNELSFKEGDKINVSSKFSDDWLIGTVNGREGRFPANFVDKIPTNLSPSSEPDIKSVEPHAFVQYNFNAEGDGELSLNAGETVVLLEKIGDDWYKGRYRGQEGIFPKTFVEVIVDVPQKKKKKSKTKVTGLGKARYQFEGEAEGDLSFRYPWEL
ncbi:uncharacterized protein [Apostichopus japonicus]|uniref:uncharacterized protein isoform X2 n=1 Tax=Stichopus japonicus TaxID=307972 RepID=UPI003AB695B0